MIKVVPSKDPSPDLPPPFLPPSASLLPSKATFLRPLTMDAIVTGPQQCPRLTQSLFMNSPYTVWQSVAEKCPSPSHPLFHSACLLLVDLFSPPSLNLNSLIEALGSIRLPLHIDYI